MAVRGEGMSLINFMSYKTCKAVGLGAVIAFTGVCAAESFSCWPRVPAEVSYLHGCEHLAAQPHIPVAGISAITAPQIVL
jgi:hypothetical protein